MASYLNFNSLVATVANLMYLPSSTDPNYQQVLPAMIADAEQRIYRELDLLATQVIDTGGVLTANSRSFTLPQTTGMFVVTNNFNIFTNVGTTTGRQQMVATSRDWINSTWPSDTAASTPSIPHWYAPITDQIWLVAPAPDAPYTMEIIGEQRPTPLSATNPSTYLTNVLPDAFLAACMIFASGYQQNFSAMADNPQQAMSWTSHYNDLIKSADTEENRKKYSSQAWTSMQPAPLATPPRA